MKKTKIHCCQGAYHILMDGRYYCMAPPNIACEKQVLDAGKFTRGKKRICFCRHMDAPCIQCDEAEFDSDAPVAQQDRAKDS